MLDTFWKNFHQKIVFFSARIPHDISIGSTPAPKGCRNRQIITFLSSCLRFLAGDDESVEFSLEFALEDEDTLVAAAAFVSCFEEWVVASEV